jgi:hypothetical protein
MRRYVSSAPALKKFPEVVLMLILVDIRERRAAKGNSCHSARPNGDEGFQPGEVNSTRQH